MVFLQVEDSVADLAMALEIVLGMDMVVTEATEVNFSSVILIFPILRIWHKIT